MKVSELIEELKSYDQDLEVWFDVDCGYFWKMSKDEINVVGTGQQQVVALGGASSW